MQDFDSGSCFPNALPLSTSLCAQRYTDKDMGMHTDTRMDTDTDTDTDTHTHREREREREREMGRWWHENPERKFSLSGISSSK